MTLTQQMITIALCVLATMLTRFLPFLIFSSSKPTPKYVRYLGDYLPPAIFGKLYARVLNHMVKFQVRHDLDVLVLMVPLCNPYSSKKFVLVYEFQALGICAI